MATGPGDRRLVLLRHAKSAYPHGVPDHERPLAGKGRRNAQATGEWFVAEGPRPDLVLCSDAVRARQTWEVACGVITASQGCEPPLRLVPALYGADVTDLVDTVRSLDDDPLGAGARCVVLVGHEPTMSATVLRLAGPGSDEAALARVQDKFPTNAVALLRLPHPWHALGTGSAVLEGFVVPRAGKQSHA